MMFTWMNLGAYLFGYILGAGTATFLIVSVIGCN